MTHENVKSKDVRERLHAYVQALGLECSDSDIETIVAGNGGLSESLELLRRQLAANFRGNFLALRLWKGFAAQPSDFRQPSMDRGPFPSAELGNIVIPDTD